MKKKVIAAVIVLGLVVAWWTSGGEAGDGKSEPSRIVKVEKGTLRMSVAATGEIRPVRQVELKSKASGQVVRFAKRDGESVKAGELLVELDQRTEQRNVQRAQADLHTGEAQLLLTRLEYDKSLTQAESEAGSAREDAVSKKKEHLRLEGLPRDSLTPQELEAARLAAVLAEAKARQADAALTLVRERKEADLKLAQARVLQAKVALEDANERLKDAQLASPIDGILLQKLVEEGQIVSSGISAASGGTAIAVVADVSVLVVDANVDETDIGKVREGQVVELSVDAHPGRKFRGSVDLIPPLGVLESNIRIYKVKVAVRGKGLELLKVGMTANVEIITSEIPDVLIVASEAVRADEGGSYVQVPEGEQPKKVAVKVGASNGFQTEILEGLVEGQEVLVTYATEGRDRPGPRGGGMMRRRT